MKKVMCKTKKSYIEEKISVCEEKEFYWLWWKIVGISRDWKKKSQNFGEISNLDGSGVPGFPKKIINIHPSLLPKYPGLNTHESVIKNGDKKHGITIHFVNDVLDGGKIIAQGEISVRQSDTLQDLKKRIHSIEHAMLPMVVSKFADGSICKYEKIYKKF